jgi:hypothetical protein
MGIQIDDSLQFVIWFLEKEYLSYGWSKENIQNSTAQAFFPSHILVVAVVCNTLFIKLHESEILTCSSNLTNAAYLAFPLKS